MGNKMKKPSYKTQIEEMCKDCIYDGSSGGGTWREQVGACTSPSCALFNLRPLPSSMKHTWQIELSKKYKEEVKGGKRRPILSNQTEDF